MDEQYRPRLRHKAAETVLPFSESFGASKCHAAARSQALSFSRQTCYAKSQEEVAEDEPMTCIGKLSVVSILVASLSAAACSAHSSGEATATESTPHPAAQVAPQKPQRTAQQARLNWMTRKSDWWSTSGDAAQNNAAEQADIAKDTAKQTKGDGG